MPTHLLRLLTLSLAVAACHRGTVPPPAAATVPEGGRDKAAPPVVVAAGATAGSAADTTPARAVASPDSSARRDTITVTRTEVAKEAVKVFGDSLGGAAGPADSALARATGAGATAVATRPAAAAEAPSWDIDVRSYETRERVAHYIELFSGPVRARFESHLQRGTRYEGMIRAKLRAAALPEDMTYLPLIESGYDPNAYSTAAAVGMWQLMTSTARGTGLRVDWWVDERRDPVRSTDAAIRFLRWLNDQFGSLYLAAAAYDGGPGRIARGLTRYADDLEGQSADERFFALAEKDYLRSETKNYVPQLIAAALVAKQPEKYGLHVSPVPPFAYDSVRVPPATPLAAVAKAAATTTRDLLELNPHILRGMTPPRDSFLIRLPPGKAGAFGAAFAALGKGERTGYRRVTSKKGETLALLARRAHLTVRELGWYNPKAAVSRRTGRLVPGQTILVPAPEVAAVAIDVPDPAVERYTKSRRIHVVRRGETLGGIARKYHTSAAALMRLNRMRKSMIFPGQALVVRGSGVHASRRGRSRRTAKGRSGSARG